MGALSAASMRAATTDDVALEWHLQYNHYPPVPVSMASVAKDAIAVVRDDPEEWEDSELPLPDGVTFRDRSTAPVSEVMDSLHLWDFVPEVEL